MEAELITKAKVTIGGDSLDCVILRSNDDCRDTDLLLRDDSGVWDSLMVDEDDEVYDGEKLIGWRAVTPYGFVPVFLDSEETPVHNPHAWRDMATIHMMGQIGGMDMVFDDMWRCA